MKKYVGDGYWCEYWIVFYFLGMQRISQGETKPTLLKCVCQSMSSILSSVPESSDLEMTMDEDEDSITKNVMSQKEEYCDLPIAISWHKMWLRSDAAVRQDSHLKNFTQ